MVFLILLMGDSLMRLSCFSRVVLTSDFFSNSSSCTRLWILRLLFLDHLYKLDWLLDSDMLVMLYGSKCLIGLILSVWENYGDLSVLFKICD